MAGGDERYQGTAYFVRDNLLFDLNGALRDSVVQDWLDGAYYPPRKQVPGMDSREARLREVIAHNTKGKKIAEDPENLNTGAPKD